MNELANFQHRCIQHDICDEYLLAWNNAKDKKTLIDLALSSEGCDFMCKSITEKWGIDKKWFKANFSAFANGRYKMNKNYSSCFFIDYKGSILANTTLILVIDSDIIIDVPSYMITKVYVCGNSKVKIKGDGKCVVVIYGDNIEVEKTLKTRIIKPKDNGL